MLHEKNVYLLGMHWPKSNKKNNALCIEPDP